MLQLLDNQPERPSSFSQSAEPCLGFYSLKPGAFKKAYIGLLKKSNSTFWILNCIFNWLFHHLAVGIKVKDEQHRTRQLVASSSSLQCSVPQPPTRQSIPHTSAWMVPSGLKGLFPPFTLMFLTWKRKFKNEIIWVLFQPQNLRCSSIWIATCMFAHLLVNDKTPVNST